MEIPEINISEIYIPEVYIPEPYDPKFFFVETSPFDIEIIGCNYQHRDIKNTGNYNLLIDDPNGVYTVCSVNFPSFTPPIYNPNRMTLVEEPLQTGGDTDIPKTDMPKIPEEKKKDEIVIPECPGQKDQRVGDYRNAKKLEIVVGHSLSKDKSECITEYKSVPFRDQYIPSANQFIGVFSLALVGASAHVVLQLVPPLLKQAVSKLTKKKQPKSKV